MKNRILVTTLLLSTFAGQAYSLALAPEEFKASRQLACVLAQESLGYLDDEQYGARTHSLLEGFDQSERDNILSKALGYVDGLMFSVNARDALQVSERLEHFVASASCASESYQQVTLSL